MVIHVDMWEIKEMWHLCVYVVCKQQVALLLSWLPPKLVHLWDLFSSHWIHTVHLGSTFNHSNERVYVYVSMCSCAHNVSVTCHWQVESTYVTIVVGIVTECVHAVWLFAVLSTTGTYSNTQFYTRFNLIFLLLSMIAVICEKFLHLVKDEAV